MKKKVLVTGGAGFIGSNLVESLIEKDYDVVVLDNLSSGYLDNLKEFSDKITFVKGDICDFDLVGKLMKDVFAVFHLAAMVSVPESVQKPMECFKVNVLASMNLIDECVKNGAKFVFASSAAVYGEDKSEVKTEDLSLEPISPYGLSKLDVERLCKIYSAEKGLKFCCFRNFNVYGPKQDVNSAYAAVIPKFIVNALGGKDLCVFGDGKQTRDFIYVKDVVSAYMSALDCDFNDVFNLGCNDVMDLITLSKLVLEKTGSKSSVVYLDERKGDIKHSRASSDKFKGKSSWSSLVGFDEGLDLTVGWYGKE